MMPSTAEGSGAGVAASSDRSLASRPVPSTLYPSTSAFQPESGSAYLSGRTQEDRSHHGDTWRDSEGVREVRITPLPEQIEVREGAECRTISLHNRDALDSFCSGIGSDVVYLDITGLPHRAWAALLPSLLRAQLTVRAVYVEPGEYKRARARYQFYDLSEADLGIGQLPGFTSIVPTGDGYSFVPILGFEDARFSYVLNEMEPPSLRRVYPIVGVPGFRPEYPFETLRSNRRTLESAPQNLFVTNARFTDAACPFRLYYTLEDIASLHPGERMKVGLLGTKPHALGAVMYALTHGTHQVELIYDHPKRKGDRTRGTHRLWVYHLSAFVPMHPPDEGPQ